MSEPFEPLGDTPVARGFALRAGFDPALASGEDQKCVRIGGCQLDAALDMTHVASGFAALEVEQEPGRIRENIIGVAQDGVARHEDDVSHLFLAVYC